MNDAETTAGGMEVTPPTGSDLSTVTPPTQPVVVAGEIVAAEKQRRQSKPHRKNCACPICKQSRGETGGKRAVVESAPVTLPILDEQTVKRSIAAVFSIIDGTVCRQVSAVALKITGDPGVAASTAAAIAASDDERALVQELGAVIWQKYQLSGKYLPEGILVCFAVAYGYRVHAALADLKKIAAEKRAATVEPSTPKQ